MDGPPNGSVHQGHHHRRSTRSHRRKGKATWSGWAADKGVKLFIWYALYQIVFRCPSSPSQINDDTNHVCRTYLHGRDFVTPYAQPYYDQYLAPYVHQAQPYYDVANEKVYKPAYAAYETYAAPRVAQAQLLTQKQWEKTIKPQLDLAQKQVGQQYQQSLAPHVKKATGVVQPYYNGVVNSAADIWELELEPVYRKTAPYAEKIYQQGQAFAVNTALPQAQFVGSTAWSFWTRNIWPRIRILYGENVEPQLMRITARLGRYKDGKKLEAEISSVEASSRSAKVSASVDSMASSTSSTLSHATESPASAASSAVHSTPSPSADPVTQFNEDLKSWEDISHKAVEEGSEDLAERIQEITAQQVKSANSAGSALVTQLEATSESALSTVKSRIQQIVKGLPEDAEENDIEAANEDLVQAVRAAGQNIKLKAQAVREWRQTRQSETESLVEMALQSTLETVDSIRELRLTEIGRKYASSSLPHKQWSKYNDIKKAKQTWRNDVEKAAHEHKGLKEAKHAVEEIEQIAMGVAEDAAKELGRLKKVGQWKIAANDASDDFETRTVPPPVRKAKEYVVEQAAAAADAASQVVLGSKQDTVESATSVVAEKASQAASQASEAVYGSKGSAESVVSQASSAASSLSEKIAGSSTGSVESAASQAKGTAASIASEASKSASDAAASASSVVLGESSLSDTIKESASSAASQISKSASAASSSISSAVVGESSLSHTVKDAASSASSAVLGESSFTDSVIDAASSATENTGDLHVDYSESVQKIINGAGDKASQLTQAIQDALKGASPTQGTVESVSSLASEQYESALSAASSALFGTQNAVDKATSSVHDQYQAAVTAASYAIYGTPATAAPLAAATASSAYSSAAAEASKHYDAVKSRISAQISGTPKPIQQQMFESAESAYSNALQAANSRYYSAFPTQGYLESISSIASSRLADGVAAAQEQYQSAKIAVGAKPKPVHERYLASAQAAWYQALGLAHGRYNEFVEAASSAIAPTPAATGYHKSIEDVLSAAQSAYSAYTREASSKYTMLHEMASQAASAQSTTVDKGTIDHLDEQIVDAIDYAKSKLAKASKSVGSAYAASATTENPLASQASENWEALISKASEQVYGAPAPFTAVAYSYATEYAGSVTDAAASATAAAAAQFEQVQALFSELVVGKEPDFTASAYSRLQSAYSTGAPNLASQISSYASDSYDSMASVVSAAFVPPTHVPTILEQVQEQLNAAVSAASVQAYGTEKGTFEQATEAAASVYSDAASQVSDAIYGTPGPYVAAAQASILDIGASASAAISAAIYGGPTPTLSAASDAAASVASSIRSKAAEQASSASAAVSSAVYGEEQTYLEGVQSQLSAAMASASSKISELGQDAGSVLNEAASTVSSAVTAASDRVRDEL
ncbi:hypothetical protein CERZMDRAFT_120169 [Cercospora zeae-maydis SCOH1-5]|uniref:Uncharacterized protein n=1 Tax=Cercospora zeae-maydis SCOH1-5 TaxID=717836 RepID=A0A6A6FNQ7_9PEZI|nr:hypothetical protein CERZMDRAFT_120169 [Cercospora zeae-maydis SCOH1-5]